MAKIQISGVSIQPAEKLASMGKRWGVKINATAFGDGSRWESAPLDPIEAERLAAHAAHLFDEGTAATVAVTMDPAEGTAEGWDATEKARRAFFLLSVVHTAAATVEAATGTNPVPFETLQAALDVGGSKADSGRMVAALRTVGALRADGSVRFPIAGTAEGIAAAAAIGAAAGYAARISRVINRRNEVTETLAVTWKNAGNRWEMFGDEWAWARQAIGDRIEGNANGTPKAATRDGRKATATAVRAMHNLPAAPVGE